MEKPCACPVLHNSPRSTKTVEKEQRGVDKKGQWVPDTEYLTDSMRSVNRGYKRSLFERTCDLRVWIISHA